MVYFLSTLYFEDLILQVSIDGHDLHEINVQHLRSHIGVVSQEPVLFEGSISENISLGKTDATKEEVVQAAKLANAHNFVEELPQVFQNFSCSVLISFIACVLSLSKETSTLLCPLVSKL